MVFPTHNSDVRTEIPSSSVHQVDTVAPTPTSTPVLTRSGLFMVYYAAIFERGRDEPVKPRIIR
jgi:hypothetical protein